MSGYIYAMITSKSSRKYADLAIDSFFKNTRLFPEDQFLLIDNDNEKTYNLKNVISNSSPQSFSKNCNSIIDYADGRNVFILSNDVVFTYDWNKPLIQYNNIILIPSCNQTHLYNCNNLNLTPNMKIEEFNSQFDDLNIIKNQHIRVTGQKFFENLLMPFYAFMLPSSVYKKIGYFDEDYGIGGGEDVDYRLRAIDLDIPVKYTTRSYILHFGGKTTWDGPETRSEIIKRDQLYFTKFVEKWNNDLAHLCLVNGSPIDVIKKYGLEKLFYSQNYSQLIKAILNITNRN